jgi:hypothetical protein
LKNGRNFVFFYIKVIRFPEVSEYFTKAYAMKGIKSIHKWYIKRILQKQNKKTTPFYEPSEVDEIKNIWILYIAFGIKLAELSNLLFLVSY